MSEQRIRNEEKSYLLKGTVQRKLRWVKSGII
jgi:hypothetical protein